MSLDNIDEISHCDSFPVVKGVFYYLLCCYCCHQILILVFQYVFLFMTVTPLSFHILFLGVNVLASLLFLKSLYFVY